MERSSMGFDLFFTAALLPCKKGVISMDREWLRILVAALLAVILPHLAIHIGSKLQQTLPEPTPGTQTEAPTTGHAPTDGSSTPIPGVKIPVQIDDGAVMLMDLEEYVRGVVLAEMPASFEAEALKAQAVAARTYTLRVLSIGGRHEPGAICIDSSCCQAYISDEDYLDGKGSAAEWEKVTQAVGDTTGLVLTYNGKLIDATYFSCSGGRTEDAAAVWGSDVPYLQAVDSPGEEGASVYENEKYFSAAEFAQRLGRNLDGTPDQWFGQVTKTDGNGVATMVIGGITYTGTQLRSLLGLRSTAFTVEADAKGVTLITKGYGHRVGMSQYGAEAMAVQGSNYQQILAHYYRGTVIDKYEDLG